MFKNIDYTSIITKKTTIIWYSFGMRGNAILRILAAHPEVYWNPAIQKVSEEFIQHPLDLPETVANFNPMLTPAENMNVWMVSYSTYHTVGYVNIAEGIGDNITALIDTWVTSNSYKSKKLFLIAHPNISNKKLSSSDYTLTLQKVPHIWVYGTINRLKASPYYHTPSTNPNAYNLNIDALYSTDYATFETEYYKLIAHFNLTSCLNRVRAFILLNLERDRYISKFY
jgi:hypothetical protein